MTISMKGWKPFRWGLVHFVHGKETHGFTLSDTLSDIPSEAHAPYPFWHSMTFFLALFLAHYFWQTFYPAAAYVLMPFIGCLLV